MNRKNLQPHLFTTGAALMIVLFLTAAEASSPAGSGAGATNVPPVAAPLSPAPATAGSTHLMPAVTGSSQNPTSSAEDIRDIRRPRHLPTRWPWVAVAVGIILSGALVLWRWLRHGKFFKMQPHEIAMQHLGEARRLMDPDQARDYCFEVSKIVRRYIEEQFRLQAPQLTTEEFLRELVEVRATMLVSQRALLANFLLHCDLAKFAGWRYCRPDLEAMHASAETFVTQTARLDSDNGKTGARGDSRKIPSDVEPSDLQKAVTL